MASQRVTIKPITATLPTGTLSRRLSHQGECPQTLEQERQIDEEMTSVNIALGGVVAKMKFELSQAIIAGDISTQTNNDEPVVPVIDDNSDVTDEDKGDLAQDTEETPPSWTGYGSVAGTKSGHYPPKAAFYLSTDRKTPKNNKITFNNKNRFSSDVTGTEFRHNIGGSFDYLIWGDWNGGSRSYTRSYDNKTFSNLTGYFVYGQPTQDLQKTGSASYKGRLFGDRIDGQRQRVIRGGVQGEIGLKAKFSDSSLTGWMSFYKTGNKDLWTVVDVKNVRITHQSSESWFEGDLSGNDKQRGEIYGTFFGPNASEIGGSYWLDYDDDGSSGVFAGKKTSKLPTRPKDPPPPPQPDVYKGYLSGTVGVGSLFTAYATTTNNGDTALRNGLNTLVSPNIAPNPRVAISSASYDGTLGSNGLSRGEKYEHTAWGDWNGNGASISFYTPGRIDRGQYVIGRVTTPTEYRGLSGNATYTGDMRGIAFDGNTVTGNIRLNADLTNNNIGGTYLMNHGGSPWISGTIANRSINIGSNSVTFNNPVSVRGGGEGQLSGMFFGPTASEVGGEWAIWNVPSGPGGADGVFRAKK